MPELQQRGKTPENYGKPKYQQEPQFASNVPNI